MDWIQAENSNFQFFASSLSLVASIRAKLASAGDQATCNELAELLIDYYLSSSSNELIVCKVAHVSLSLNGSLNPTHFDYAALKVGSNITGFFCHTSIPPSVSLFIDTPSVSEQIQHLRCWL